MDTAMRTVVRDVVADQAPHELVLLDSMEPLDDGQITAALTGREKDEAGLGFGLTDVTPLVTPVVWLVLHELVSRGATTAVDGIMARVRRLSRRRSGSASAEESPAVPTLTADELDAVHTRIREQAAQVGIGTEESQRLADAVVARLARGRPTEPQPRQNDGQSAG
ncbi:hypothetical protein ABZ923_08245 [Streptomyces sp. NPDC046881]|uniref:hypothetical protein n=1 Tax=Streptomyces sp. NPDC046881 TaxID=3155374 RepID=UPI0033F04CEB